MTILGEDQNEKRSSGGEIQMWRTTASIPVWNGTASIAKYGKTGYNTATSSCKEVYVVNKRELIAGMIDESGLTKADAEKALNAFLHQVEKALKEGDKVQLTGFGSFEIKNRAERTGRNPRTKETVVIPASKVPVFKAGKSLKDAVN